MSTRGRPQNGARCDKLCLSGRQLAFYTAKYLILIYLIDIKTIR